jgi:hypothetical protein
MTWHQRARHLIAGDVEADRVERVLRGGDPEHPVEKTEHADTSGRGRSGTPLDKVPVRSQAGVKARG